jgi:hypothetical protein
MPDIRSISLALGLAMSVRNKSNKVYRLVGSFIRSPYVPPLNSVTFWFAMLCFECFTANLVERLIINGV